jgi:hypothetical protein
VLPNYFIIQREPLHFVPVESVKLKMKVALL